jgi:hypothetical protein
LRTPIAKSIMVDNTTNECKIKVRSEPGGQGLIIKFIKRSTVDGSTDSVKEVSVKL